MVSSLYASVSALLLAGLSLRVIKLRRAKKISFGDGGDAELYAAMRAQGNAAEYIPVVLILLISLELQGAHGALVHVGGLAGLAGRLLHARGLLAQRHGDRVLGMQLTLFTLVGLALANLGYGIYAGLRSVF
ncbi:MAPEG family protein [Methylogaea oryzae]|uniref:Membrane protein n=1 Tax=Methylogaea oryzae TaxID=1295382 RepID=A0A8D4VLX6_9GAMM|nr:MAPEG family protein [Methylogaea oryzae]BBL69669.1 membrane protein [Methylogaea oryzae]